MRVQKAGLAPRELLLKACEDSKSGITEQTNMDSLDNSGILQSSLDLANEENTRLTARILDLEKFSWLRMDRTARLKAWDSRSL